VKNPSLGRVLRLAVAAGLTAFLLWRSDPGKVLQAALHADLRWIALAIALVAADRALMAYRWLVLLRPLAHESLPPFRSIMRIFFVSTFLGTFLPGSVGGDAVRALSLARHNVSGAASVASVFMDRMLGVASVLLLGVVALPFAPDLAGNSMVMVGLLLAAAACGVTVLLVFSARAAAAAQRVAARAPIELVRRAGHSVIDAIQRYASSHLELVNVLAGSLGVQILRVVQAYCLGMALGIQVPILTYFAFIPLILLVMLLPVTINGLGTSQAAFLWLFARVGVLPADAFALSVLFVALGVVGNLPGGFLYAAGGATGERQATG
jgi:uncharacterized protein (TIRG00374 family)